MAARAFTHRFTNSRGHAWRVQSNEDGTFDEIVVSLGPQARPNRNRHGAALTPSGGFMLHAEMCDERSCFIDVAGFCLWVFKDDKGIVRITMAEDRRNNAAYPLSLASLRDPDLDAPKRRRAKGARPKGARR